MHVTEAFIESIRSAMPELPDDRRARYAAELQLGDYDAAWLTQDPEIADYFEAAAAAAEDAKLAANWVMGDLSAALNREEIGIARSPISPSQLGDLIRRIRDETISSKIAKTVFEALWAGEGEVDEIIAARGLEQVSDAGEIEDIIAGIVAENPDQVEQFRAGKEKVLGFFVGQVMKATQGKANPKQVNELLRKALAPDPD